MAATRSFSCMLLWCVMVSFLLYAMPSIAFCARACFLIVKFSFMKFFVRIFSFVRHEKDIVVKCSNDNLQTQSQKRKERLGNYA